MPGSPLYVLPFDEVRLDVPSSDGVTAVAYDWGGDGPPLVFAHATGLHSHCYAPLAARLRDRFTCYAVDTRSQGAGSVPENGVFAWQHIGDDFTNALEALGLLGRGDVFGIGHSQGGAMVMTAEQRKPGTFAGIFGFEAVVFPGDVVTTERDNLMAGIARRRREVFESRQAAYDNYRIKPPLNGIDDECLRAYVQWGFEDLDDGTVCLRCRAESEARVFEGAAARTPGLCESVMCPTTVGVSEYTNDMFKLMVAKQAETLAHGTLMQFPGRSHFGPLERIDEMAATITEIFLGHC